MSVFQNKENDYVIKILNSIEEIKNIFEINNFILESYKYDLEIYMINKNEKFSKIKKIQDIKNYAVIKDENGNRKLILKDENEKENVAKIYSIFFAHELLYNLGYYELFYINKDIYSYKKECNSDLVSFEILDIKNQGCFFNINNVALEDLKKVIINLKEIGLNIETKNLKIDYIQKELNKVLFKRKK